MVQLRKFVIEKKVSLQVKEMESLLQNEKAQREYMEEKIAKQRTEIEETKRQRDQLYYDLQDVKEQRLRLQQVVSSTLSIKIQWIVKYCSEIYHYV